MFLLCLHVFLSLWDGVIPLAVALLLFFFYCIIFYCPSAAANKRISVLFCSVLYDMSSLKFVPYVRAKGLDAVSVV